jgi:iron complex outermembrane receptor protein
LLSARLRLSPLLVFVLLLATLGAGQQPAELGDLSLEELMNVRVTSAAKKEQNLLQIPAAVYVITAEDIRRAGVTTLPDALRLAPGVQVAQLSSDAWAVSIRGFNALYSNKLLVLIDGRSVYSSVFSGVLWNEHDLMLDDVERIEVIRGPGAALWGANAVNGVVNIITKRARDTRGALLTLGAGGYDRALGQARYGGFSRNLDYRIYAKYFNRGSLGGVPGAYPGSGWEMTRGGFRADWQPTGRDGVTAEGSLYRGQTGQIAYQIVPYIALHGPAPLVDSNGGDLLLSWKRTQPGGSEISSHAYYQRYQRGNFILGQNENSLDLDLQHHLTLEQRHDFIWGASFRSTRVRSSTVEFADSSISPAVELPLFSVFLHDEVAILPQRLWLTAGSKFEHNSYTGWELQPSLRLLWKLQPNHAVWAAVSRAARTPSVYETTIRMPVPLAQDLPLSATLVGNPHLQSESLLAFEVGYRSQLVRHLWLDAAAFYNRYRGLTSETPVLVASPGPLPQVLLEFGNDARGQTYGGELSASYVVSSFWNLQGNYSLFRDGWGPGPGNRDAKNVFVPGQTPRHQFQIRSAFTPLSGFDFDANFYYLSAWTMYPVPALTRLDTRLGWAANDHVQLDLVLQNLLQPRHTEFFSSGFMGNTELVKRAVFGKMTFKF